MTNTTTRRFPLASIVLGTYEGTESPEYRDEVALVTFVLASGDAARAHTKAWALTGQTFHPDRW